MGASHCRFWPIPLKLSENWGKLHKKKRWIRSSFSVWEWLFMSIPYHMSTAWVGTMSRLSWFLWLLNPGTLGEAIKQLMITLWRHVLFSHMSCFWKKKASPSDVNLMPPTKGGPRSRNQAFQLSTAFAAEIVMGIWVNIYIYIYIHMYMYLLVLVLLSGWWFQTLFIFHNIWDNIFPIDFHIFQDG